MPPPLGLTVKQALAKFGPEARAVLKEKFASANQKYPPDKLLLIGLKTERKILMFADNKYSNFKPVLIATFPLTTFSGTLGPKLRQGDLQIPEGYYAITGLAASFRLALKVAYPNQFDCQMAKRENRTNLGGDILVHNGTVSTGCLVVSMPDMQEIFIATNDVGVRNVSLVIAPCNLVYPPKDCGLPGQPAWVSELYKKLRVTLERCMGKPVTSSG